MADHDDRLESVLLEFAVEVEQDISSRFATMRAELKAEMRAEIHSRVALEGTARPSGSERVVSERLAEALDAAARAAAAATTVAARIEKSSSGLSRRERRHELKLVRAESSRRVSDALTKLEQRGGSLIGELEARVARANQALAVRADSAGERIENAERRLREATARFEGADEEAIKLAQHADALAAQSREAARLEAQAAATLAAAERRLLDLMSG